MAKKKEVTVEEIQEEKEEVIDYDNLNMEEKVTVISNAPWRTYFRRSDNMADVMLPPQGSMRFPRSEIITQVQNDNRLFTGIDGLGSNATYYIDDKATRLFLNFENQYSDNKQKFLSQETIKQLFDIKDVKEFENAVKEQVVTISEKRIVMELIDKLNLNDYRKIRFIENYVANSI